MDRNSDEPKITVSPPSRWETSTLAGLLAIIQEDREANGRSLIVPGTQVLLNYRLGQWLDDPARNRVVRKIGMFFYRAGAAYARNFLGFEVRKEAKLGRRVQFAHQHGVVIAPATEIGDDTLILHGVTIGLRGHSVGAKIGARVVISAGAKVLGSVRIGDDATVGPNAVVMTDVPAGASVIAAPSRILRLQE